MVEGSSELEQARKNWRQRNSDGRNTFEGERTQAPPAFDLEEHDLSLTTAQRPGTDPLSDDEDETDPGAASARAEDGAAIRHVHVYDESLEDPDA